MVLPLSATSTQSTEQFTLYEWTNQSAPTSAMVPLLVHGLGGCLAWMEPFIESLNQQFPVVAGMDIAMYGPSDSATGYIPHRHALLGLIHQGIQAVHQHYNKPVLLIGLSLGGLIVTHALARAETRQPVGGVVLISPAFKASSRSFRPKTYANVLIRSMLARHQHHPITIPYDITGITSDPDQQARLRQSTGCITSLTAGSFMELLKLTLSRRQFKNLNYPLCMIRAEEDDICDVAAMDKEWRQWPHKQKQLTIFANMKHDLVLEPVYPQMANAIYGWQQHLR